MCGCFVLSGAIGSCMFFVSMVFPFSGLETRSSLQKTTTPHQHNASGWSRSASGIASFPKCLSFRSTCVFFDPKGQTGRHLRPSTPENQIPIAGAGVSDVSGECLLYRCTKKGPKKEGLNCFHVVNVVGRFFLEFWKYTGLPRRETKKSEKIVVPSHGKFPGALGRCDHLSSWQKNGRSEPTQVERLSDFLAFTRFPTTWSWDSCSGSVEMKMEWKLFVFVVHVAILLVDVQGWLRNVSVGRMDRFLHLFAFVGWMQAWRRVAQKRTQLGYVVHHGYV